MGWLPRPQWPEREQGAPHAREGPDDVELPEILQVARQHGVPEPCGDPFEARGEVLAPEVGVNPEGRAAGAVAWVVPSVAGRERVDGPEDVVLGDGASADGNPVPDHHQNGQADHLGMRHGETVVSVHGHVDEAGPGLGAAGRPRRERLGAEHPDVAGPRPGAVGQLALDAAHQARLVTDLGDDRGPLRQGGV